MRLYDRQCYKESTFKYVVNNDSLANFIFDDRLAMITVGRNTYNRSYVVTSKGYQFGVQ